MLWPENRHHRQPPFPSDTGEKVAPGVKGGGGQTPGE